MVTFEEFSPRLDACHLSVDGLTVEAANLLAKPKVAGPGAKSAVLASFPTSSIRQEAVRPAMSALQSMQHPQRG